MGKKYYWLQLKEDFFRQKEIKLLRKIAGGEQAFFNKHHIAPIKLSEEDVKRLNL